MIKCQNDTVVDLNLVINKKLINIVVAILFFTLLCFQAPSYAFGSSDQIKMFSSNTYVIGALKYESKDPTTLENPVTDPNFNVMRKQELGKGFAIPLVVGILLIAIAAPIATWLYFSK